ncbi:MAG: arylsulfatase [Acidobacteria bacterium]|nr:arylsulfatase [Acidobacteriota bacterium]
MKISQWSLTRRDWIRAAAVAGGARSALGQDTNCTVPADSIRFRGVAGRTAAESKPAPLTPATAAAGSPNILYILLDDTGFADLHCYGSEISTPHMDALAASGLLYNNFHAKAICSPSRAALLTGRNGHSVGLKELSGDDQGFPHSRGRVTPAAATVAQLLQAAGYSTMGTGKWHLAPARDVRASGDRAHWPLQKGFDRWYGFLGGWTDQYQPNLVEDNHFLPKPAKPGYHFSVDIIDRSIAMLGEHVAADRAKPFFLHVAFGATHTPVQVPKPYVDKYTKTYENGWDALREARYRRQMELGIVPPRTRLPARNPGDPAWAGLSERERRVFARFMAAYAGFLEHTDEQIGRLVSWLKENKLFDNTVIFLMSDNGGAPEAGNRGNFRRAYGDTSSLEEVDANLDDMGGPKTQPLYQRAWAMASVAPFKFYKLWPYAGGTQTPCIVSWPAGIRKPGIRRQFIDIIDITPTVLEIAKVTPPAAFRGVCQMPIHGRSIRATFDDPEAPDPRDSQYFELWGSRSIRHKGWKAVAIHRPGTSFDLDRWELYNVNEDFSESVDLAARFPAKLEELKKLWWAEAERYGALPLIEAPGGRIRTYDQAAPPL